MRPLFGALILNMLFMWSISKDFYCFPHILPYLNPKGTTCFADAAPDALSCVMLQSLVVLTHSLQHSGLGQGKVQKLCDIRHINLLGTRGTVAAIHTMAVPADFREGGKGQSIVLLLISCFLIGKALPQLPDGTEHNECTGSPSWPLLQDFHQRIYRHNA